MFLKVIGLSRLILNFGSQAQPGRSASSTKPRSASEVRGSRFRGRRCGSIQRQTAPAVGRNWGRSHHPLRFKRSGQANAFLNAATQPTGRSKPSDDLSAGCGEFQKAFACPRSGFLRSKKGGGRKERSERRSAKRVRTRKRRKMERPATSQENPKGASSGGAAAFLCGFFGFTA